MKITKRSPLTGEENTLEIDVTQEQLDAWKGGQLIQNVMPKLTKEEREFIMTGYTAEDWKAMFPPEDESEEEQGDEDSESSYDTEGGQ